MSKESVELSEDSLSDELSEDSEDEKLIKALLYNENAEDIGSFGIVRPAGRCACIDGRCPPGRAYSGRPLLRQQRCGQL